jgi:hypothetical protein
MSDPTKKNDEGGGDDVPAAPAGKVEVTDDYLKNFGKWDDSGAGSFACSCNSQSCNN